MRKQYHFRPSDAGLQAWDVDKLVALTNGCDVQRVPLDKIGELSEPYWFGDGAAPSVSDLIEHFRMIEEADLSFPIILSPDGRVMDGMHRVAKAALRGESHVLAHVLPFLPPPDHVGVDPDDLPY